jgi:hypothetical protein
MSDTCSIARRRRLAVSLSLVALALALALGLGVAPSTSQQLHPDHVDGFPARTYFQATRPDPRLCPSPLCGGVFVKQVNRRLLRCPDGSRGVECLANVINWSLLGLDPAAEARLNAEFLEKRVLVRGELALDDSAVGIYPLPSVLFVREAWRGVTGKETHRRFFGVVPSGIVCITFPCPSFLRTPLNWPQRPRLLHDVNLGAFGASDDEIAQGLVALHSGGLIVSGYQRRFKGLAGLGRVLIAQEFYTRVTAEPRVCGGFTFPPNPPCQADEFCDPPPDSCFIADLPGTCTPVDEACPEIYDPVCGCDGQTYSSDCVRLMARVALSHPGECEGGGTCGATVCAPGTTCCNPLSGLCTPPGVPCIQ